MKKRSISEFNTLKAEFEALTSFEDKLKFWDAKGLSFKDDSYASYVKIKPLNTKPASRAELEFLKGEEIRSLAYEYGDSVKKEYFNIRPTSTSERLQYNKWIVNHWREQFIGVENDKVELIYRSFETLKHEYSGKIASGKKKSDVITSEQKATITKIDILCKTKEKRNTYNFLYSKFLIGQEDDLLHYKITATNVLIELRFIARVWDLIQYQIFLEKEQKLGRTSRIYEIDFVVFNKLPLKQIEVLYDTLIAEKFIEGSFDTFKQVFRLEMRSDDSKIFWVNQGKSKYANVQTLFEFIYGLIRIETPPGLLYKFLLNNFSAKIIPHFTELSYDGLKNSRGTYIKNYRKERKGPRLKIHEIVNKFI